MTAILRRILALAAAGTRKAGEDADARRRRLRQWLEQAGAGVASPLPSRSSGQEPEAGSRNV